MRNLLVSNLRQQSPEGLAIHSGSFGWFPRDMVDGSKQTISRVPVQSREVKVQSPVDKEEHGQLRNDEDTPLYEPDDVFSANTCRK